MIDIIPNWHPVFVHFTVALLIIAATLHLLSHFVRDSELAGQLAIVGRWNLWIGAGLTLLTAASGWYAYNTVGHDAPSHLAMTEHRNWALSTLALFMGIAGWEYYLHRHGKSKGWPFTGLLVVAAVLLLATAWHGGELVYRYGLGVMSLPQPEGPGHTHEHGDGHDHGGESTQSGNAEGHPHSHDETAAHDDHAPDTDHPKAGHTHPPGTPPHQD